MIRTYEDGDLKSGFMGTRVAVSVAGKVKQKYFSNANYAHPTAIRLAKELEDKWKLAQENYKRNVIKSKASNTKIVGLSFSYDDSKNLKRPRIIFQHKTPEKNVVRRWRINPEMEIPNDVWEEICLLMKNTRVMKSNTYEKLRLLKPSPINFYKG